MSGLYPDVPGNRMAYHRDGSAGFLISNLGVLTTLTTGNLQTFNDENDGTSVVFAGTNMGVWTTGLVFPELRDIAGYFIVPIQSGLNIAGVPLEVSANTTTGQDGTWTSVTPWVNGGTTQPTYRTAINAISQGGKKGIRWGIQVNGAGNQTGLQTAHIYGKPTAGQVRYLMFTDTGGTEVTGPYFDFGDDPRGGAVEVKTFKIKNGHATLTANTITLSCSTLTDKSPSFADDYTFSPDGVTYSPTLAVGTLAAGASSATLYVKRTTPIGAALGLEAPLFSAVAASWT